MRGRIVAAVAIIAAVGTIATVITLVVRKALDSVKPIIATPEECTLVGTPYTLSTDQAANAATVTAVATARGLPREAAVVALATALQESKLKNLRYGDRDSLGLFQQRPSQGWGDPADLIVPRYAAGRFYDALVKVRGWQDLSVTQAAQAVQRSAYPEAYQQWSDQADALARAFTGAAPGLLTCSFPPPTEASTPARVVTELALEVPGARLLAASGRTGDVLPRSWAAANWLIAHANRFGIVAVEVPGRRWHHEDGWSADTSTARDRLRIELAADTT